VDVEPLNPRYAAMQNVGKKRFRAWLCAWMTRSWWESQSRTSRNQQNCVYIGRMYSQRSTHCPFYGYLIVLHFKHTAMTPQLHGNAREQSTGSLGLFSLRQNRNESHRRRRPAPSHRQRQRLLKELPQQADVNRALAL
jgi:hypothetical protein